VVKQNLEPSFTICNYLAFLRPKPLKPVLLSCSMQTLAHRKVLLTRKQLAERWQVSVETIKRREKGKLIKPVRLDGRVLRYRLSEIMRFEGEEAL
jgi:hypothetical protein